MVNVSNFGEAALLHFPAVLTISAFSHSLYV